MKQDGSLIRFFKQKAFMRSCIFEFYVVTLKSPKRRKFSKILNKKGMKYLFYYMPPTPNKMWQNKGQQNTTNFGQNKSSFFVKTELQHI